MDTPLNKAHFYSRKSQNSSGSDLKIQYLEKTIENFNLALAQVTKTNPKAIESIQLQKEYYEKQLVLLNFKKTFVANKKVGAAVKKVDEEITFIEINDKVVKSTNIQKDLFKNINLGDKLLEDLKKTFSPSESPQISDLMQLNSQFKTLFEQLISCVDDTVSENEFLKERLCTVDESKTDNAYNTAIKFDNKEDDVDSDSDSSPTELPPLDEPEFNLDSLGK